MAIKVEVTEDDGEFIAWAVLDDRNVNDKHPRERGESFVIGLGPTKHVALDLAKKDLEQALRQVDVLVWDAINGPPAVSS